jgi:hypothetical protein
MPATVRFASRLVPTPKPTLQSLRIINFHLTSPATLTMKIPRSLQSSFTDRVPTIPDIDEYSDLCSLVDDDSDTDDTADTEESTLKSSLSRQMSPPLSSLMTLSSTPTS